jgi:porphobilinogen synthase
MAKRYTGINLHPKDFIYPYFAAGGKGKKERIRSFPGVFRFSVDRLLEDLSGTVKLGIDKVLLFGVPDKKDEFGREAYSSGNIVAAAVAKIKRAFPGLIVMTDVCLCAYTTHGHCGIVSRTEDRGPGIGQIIDNYETIKTLAKIALSHAEAGADYVAPSAMAKGQVAAIRQALDREGYRKTKIMGYSAKFASNFYGPFRNAADSSPRFGDRKGYQLDYSDPRSALIEIKTDIGEGADIVMVKPALAYLDIIKEASRKFKFPLAAYNVSGEYAMVKAYVKWAGGRGPGAGVERGIVFEILTSIKRAGAEYIITYHAKDAARWLKEN